MTARMQAAFALLALVPALALAQSKKGSANPARAQAVAAAPKGAAFRAAGQDYRVVPGIKAVKASAPAPDGRSLAVAQASNIEELERKGPYTLFVPRGGDAAAEQAMASSAPANAVAVNERSGNLGVITGTITARLPSKAAAQGAAQGAGVTLSLFSPGSGYAFFRAPAGADVLAVAAALAGRPEVKGVEVEVREAFDEAQ